MEFTMENIVLALCSTYLAIRSGQEIYRYAKSKFIHDYLLLKNARQYKKNTEAYHYHLFHLAQKLLNENKAQKASKYLEIILHQNSDYPMANYLLGAAYLQQNINEKAWMHLDLENKKYPDHPMILFFLARCYKNMNNPTKALESLHHSIEFNPYYYPSYLLGLEIFQQLHVDPKTEWEFFHQAEVKQCLIKPVWQRMAELEKSFLSEAECIKRTKIYESLEESWVQGTKTKERIMKAIAEKRFFQAENLVIEGMRINPHDNQIYQIYDQLLVRQRKFTIALSFYQHEYQRINPNPLEATLRLTDYFVYNKEYQRALDLMLQVFQQYSNAKFLHYPLCLLYNWLNKPDDALNHLAKAITFDKGVKKLAQNNPELENLRKAEKFQQLLR